jgi:hypothetical protein
MTLLVPDAGQLSQVMAQSTGPAFILGAVAGFTSISLGRMTRACHQLAVSVGGCHPDAALGG